MTNEFMNVLLEASIEFNRKEYKPIEKMEAS
jgi:hypothetical protein